MANSKEKKWDYMKLESIEAQLRCLSNVKIPKALKSKLLEKIPVAGTVGVQGHRILLWHKVCRFGLAVAAVVILALILMAYYNTSVPSRAVVADINDRPARHSLVDQNNTIVDTNYVGYNSPPLNLLSRQ